MTTPTVSFRLKTEVYLKLEAIAAESGQTPGGYLKAKLESDTNDFLEDLEFMKADVSEILRLLQLSSEGSQTIGSTIEEGNIVNKLMPMILESLLILREIGAPNKVATAQKLVKKSGLEAYNSLEK